jgi:hypothetical protein
MTITYFYMNYLFKGTIYLTFDTRPVKAIVGPYTEVCISSRSQSYVQHLFSHLTALYASNIDFSKYVSHLYVLRIQSVKNGR